MGTQIPSEAGDFDQMLESVSTPAELRELLNADGVDDKVVAEFARAAGVDGVLDRIFGLMGTRFVPDRAGGGAGSVQWDITTPDGPRTYHLDIAAGRATGGRGAPEKATVTLAMSLPHLLRLCTGELNGVTGVMSGKIKVSGNMMFGAKMQGWFDYS
ncbi:SCP2 sterol-binding domain-containing protein [Actinomadura oligospora]|uniref:SCP2 sterol-binding domain-containing protein n=1 Tax=Actinomadura oligospora TaxID=111804 RepID=UPI0004B416BA|nr:SCP2 sterol-binding domain-containing protein [Actinomadura oligospora]